MKELREDSIEYNGNEFKVHPAGGGNPEEDRITELIVDTLPDVGTLALIECGTGVIASFAKGGVTSFHSNWIDFEYGKINAPEAKHIFGDFACIDIVEKFDTIILRITKSVSHNLKMISRALSLLNVSGKVLVAGGNKEGIKGIQSKLKKSGVITSVSANGGGGRVLEILHGEELDYVPEEISTSYQLGETQLDVITHEGLFSYGKVDRGSQQLLNFIPTFKKKHVLDLGCGSGVLSLAAVAKGAASVTATDISAMAIDATSKNCSDVENFEVTPSYIGDGFDNKFDVILTNPPFHEGKGTTNNLGEEWLDNCKRLLSGKGTIYLVANQFLSYNRWGRERFDIVEELSREEGFVVYMMKGPKR